MHDFIIIGGGLSGVSFAHYAAAAGKKVLIIEKNDHLGGCIHSVAPYDDSNFFVEMGSHAIYSSYATMIEMIKAMGITDEIQPQSMTKPFIMWSKKGLGSLFTHINYFEGALMPLKIPFVKKAGKSVREYYSAVFGKRNFEGFIKPITSAVICQDSSDVSADLLLKRRQKDKTMPRRFTFKHGMSTFINAIDGIDSTLSATVTNIIKTDDGYAVTAGAKSYYAKNIVIATEANAAAKLLKDIMPNIAAHLELVPINKTKAMAISALKQDIGAKQFAYAIGKDGECRAVVSKDVVPDDKYRGCTFHFKPEATPLEHLPEIQTLFKIDGDIKIFEEEFALPRLGIAHHDWLKKMLDMLSEYKNFYLVGNYFGGLSMEDCAIRGKQEAIRAINL